MHGRNWEILIGDVREQLALIPENSIHCVVTSPPYWGLRDYQVDGQIGSEPTLQEFIAVMVDVFDGVKRVLRPDGVCWLNLGDTYNGIGGPGKQSGGPIGPTAATAIEGTKGRNISEYGLKKKDLCMVPARVAIALQDAGWWLRDEIVWHKPSPMPGSQRDRCTSAHEMIYQLTKSSKYFFDQYAIAEPSSTEPHSPGYVNGELYAVGPMDRGGHSQREQPDRMWGGGSTRVKRNVWTIATQSYKGAHFATFPESIPETCIKAGTSEKGCCPKCGAPWSRVTEKQRVRTRPGDNTKIKTPGKNSRVFVDRDPAHSSERKQRDDYRDTTEIGNRDDGRHVTEVKHAGWEPTCDCGIEETSPCIVLDPFNGSGTTGKVAVEMGRKYIGIELNPEYAELSRDRITNPKKHAAPNAKPIKPAEGQMEMF